MSLKLILFLSSDMQGFLMLLLPLLSDKQVYYVSCLMLSEEEWNWSPLPFRLQTNMILF